MLLNLGLEYLTSINSDFPISVTPSVDRVISAELRQYKDEMSNLFIRLAREDLQSEKMPYEREEFHGL